MNHSSEITKFKNDFKAWTKIRVLDVIEEKDWFHYKRLVLPPLNCEQLTLVAEYIKNRFWINGTYTHRSVKMHEYGGRLVITADKDIINKVIV